MLAESCLPRRQGGGTHLGAGLNVVLDDGEPGDGKQRLRQLERDGAEVGTCSNTDIRKAVGSWSCGLNCMLISSTSLKALKGRCPGTLHVLQRNC